MKLATLAILLALVAAPAAGDDQQKAEKQLRKIAAMATDVNARRIVSRAVADTLSVKRGELVQQRRIMNLDYGSLLVARELIKSGSSVSEITAQLKAGDRIAQIANRHNADWKQIARQAKKLNSRIEDGIYKHFLSAKNKAEDTQRDVSEGYDPKADAVGADFQIAASDIEQAQRNYVFWRNQASRGQSDQRLDTATEKAAYFDHATTNRAGGAIPAPAAGGVPPN